MAIEEVDIGHLCYWVDGHVDISFIPCCSLDFIFGPVCEEMVKIVRKD